MSYAFYVQQNKSALSDDDSIFIFDAVNNIHESLPNEVTKYPVAGSQDRVDHIQPQNNIITFVGYVNENPIPNRLGNTTDTNVLESSGSSRIANAKNILVTIRDTGATFSFIKKNTVYKNCVIKSLDFDTNAQNEDMLVVNLTIEQIRVSTVSTAVATVIEDDATEEKSTGGNGKTTGNFDRVLDTLEDSWDTISGNDTEE